MGPAIRRIPAVLSALLLGAHFLRGGDLAWTGISLTLPLLLFVRSPWAIRVVQVSLVTAAGVWVLAAVEIARMRLAEGRPWIRMACILGAVMLLSLWSAWLLQGLPPRQSHPRQDRQQATNGEPRKEV